MSNDQGPDSLNRRHFMVTAIGASAALAASAAPRVRGQRLHHEEPLLPETR